MATQHNTTRARTTINGFTVSIDDDGYWVQRGQYCSSLAVVENCGYITNSNEDGRINVRSVILDEILDWALANGY